MRQVLRRAKQVWSALVARITPEDQLFVAEHLNDQEQELFWQMALVDQYHAIQVAKTAMQMAVHHSVVDHVALCKAALLHDVGKKQGDISTCDKILTVLVHAISPQLERMVARPGKGGQIDNLRHAFYIYGHHACRGARFAAQAGVEPQIIKWISRHHQTPLPTDPIELKILQEADDRH